MELKQGSFEGWGILELMGRQQEIGFITTEAYGTAVLFRIDVPSLDEREFVLTAPEYVDGDWVEAGAKVKRPGSPARTRLVSPNALYALNPCSEEAARTALEAASHRPLILIEAPPKKLIEPREQYVEEYDPETDSRFDSGVCTQTFGVDGKPPLG